MKQAQVDYGNLTVQRLRDMTALRNLDFNGILQQAMDPNTGQLDEDKLNVIIDNLEMQSEQQSIKSELSDDMADNIENMVNVTDQTESMPLPRAAKNKTFNLKKSAQMGMGYDESIPNAADDAFRNEQAELQGEPFEEQPIEPDSISTTMELLENVYQSPVEFVESFRHRVSPEKMDDFEKLVSVYYEDLKGRPEVDQLNKEKAAEQILDAMTNDEGVVEVPAQWEGSVEAKAVENAIKESEAQIKKLAYAYAKKKKGSKPYNLKKEAQHHTDQSIILYGPGEKRIDPFYRQPVSDWHILERNKGFGQDIDGVWNVDWETIWRGTVMDKYSRPYRDSKTGEWIGGYIQKRFEVDKNIPEQNNMQLLPGQTRKPRLPEKGSTESRLQAMRAKNDRGYGPQTNTDKPCDWNAEGDKEYAKIASGSFNLTKQAKKKV